MAVAFLICHLYQLKELEKLLLMVPLGGEKSHGQNELEPSPFPGGKQQLKMPGQAKVFFSIAESGLIYDSNKTLHLE